jgi:hypothetical protein
MIKDLLEVGLGVLDKVIPDPKAREKAKQDLIKLEQQGKLLEIDAMAKVEKIAAEDRDSARSLQKEAIKSEDKFVSRFIYYFAGFWSIFGAIFLACITFIEIPASNQRFADTIIGFLLGTIIAGIVQYFFGSSSGSKSKTDMLAK